MSLANRASTDMVGEDASYLVMYNIWGRPYANVLPFSFTIRFYFIRFNDGSDHLFCDIVRLQESSDPITFMSSNCVYSLYMAATALSPRFLIPSLDVICGHVTSTASL